MLNRILEKIAGNYNQKELNKLRQRVEKINKIDQEMMDLSDEEIKKKTAEFQSRLHNGETLEDILDEAFATVKQACRRLVGHQYKVKWDDVVWNMVPYDVQLIGGIILHQGKIAEMKTGEGKTLVASLATYLNALEWKGVHVVTVNDYLASRDAQWMKPVYEWLDLSVGSVVQSTPVQQRRAEYEKDITYVENAQLGFDYLRDNLVKSLDQRVLTRRPMHYAIVDEVDSILIDDARTPLIISNPDDTPTDKYEYYAKIVKILKPSKFKKKVSKWFLHEMINDIKNDEKEETTADDGHYYLDEKTKTASLSSLGIEKLEEILWVKNIYQELGYQEIHHIENALKAQAVYRKDTDYIIAGKDVLIVDQNTGRAMPGRRFGQGLHQAIEAKEGLTIQKESKTIATITYQNFFKIYKKASGMTGTGITEGEEFDKIYNLEVRVIPTNKPILRVDKDDKVFFNQTAKWNAIIDHITFAHKIGQPVLIGTSSIHTSEYISQLLKKHNLTHSVLNAKYHEKEAHIVSNAGKYKSIMVATNMAWRGTDIKLDKELNTKLANNYVERIDDNLHGKAIGQKEVNGVSAVVYSDVEFEWLMDAVTHQYGLTDEQVNNAAKDWTRTDHGHTFKITYNRKKKQPTDAFAEIVFRPTDSNDASVIEIDVHFGLCILGTEKHESRRIDNQLRGRAGRQGDPGISVFYVALDDMIMKKMWGEKIQWIASLILPKEEREKMELTQKQFTNSIIRSQKQMEWWHFGIRKHLFDYDNVINRQRMRIYNKRDEMLFALKEAEGKALQQENSHNDESKVLDEVTSFVDPVVSEFVTTHISLQTPTEDMIHVLQKEFNLQVSDNHFDENSYENLHAHISTHITDYLNTLLTQYTNPIIIETVLTRIYLNVIDRHWIDHIDAMQHLRDKVGLMWYAKQDPLVVYKKEAFEKFQTLLHNVKLNTLVAIMNTDFSQIQPKQEESNATKEAEATLMGMLKNVAKEIKTPAGEKITVQRSADTQSNLQKNKTVYESEEWFEIFEVEDENEAATTTQVIETKKKLRPNDKVSVRYNDGSIHHDVKYKKVKEDIEKKKCVIID